MNNTCKICNKTFDESHSFSLHLFYFHKTKVKDYYDKFLKSEKEGYCLFCNVPLKFKNINKGYGNYCNNSCSMKDKTKKLNELRWSDLNQHEKLSCRNIKNWRNKEYRNKMINMQKNLWKDNEYRDRVIKNGENHCRWGKRHSIETLRKLSCLAAARALNNPDRNCGIGRKGWFESKKNNTKIFYQSSYELKAFEILEQIKSISSYKRCKFAVDYINPKDSRMHHYIPDIEIDYNDGTKHILEIKPEYLINDEVNKAKFAAAREKFNNFNVWTEKNLWTK